MNRENRLPSADEAGASERRERAAAREKPMRCPADPDPHFLADCFDATHAAMLDPAAVRAASHEASPRRG